MPSHLGKLDVKSVREGEGRIPMEAALPGVSNADLTALKNWHWSEELTEDTRTAIFQIEVRSYLLQVDGLNVLIDTCCGNDKERSAPWAHRLQTPWLHNLASAGCHPGDVHLVLCTHLHADHVGWNTRLDNGRWVPTFPNARYVFSRKDFDYFGGQTREAYDREAYADSVLPVVAAGLADIVDSDHCIHREIEDGIWLEDAAGHSPGTVVVNAQRGGARLLFTGDILHHPIQLVRPDLAFVTDEDPPRACATRQGLLEQCAGNDAVLYPAHFPDPAAGRVRRAGRYFAYDFIR
jgi:glyoxylase-like metal-dependent hydrolase (beta-lactamase superfamily II)